jgi:hypothetical protein
VTADPGEGALRKELGRALKTARASAGLVQRELAHKVGYSRSRVAGAEGGDYVSQQFWERCDVVLGTTLADGYAVIRTLRTQRLFAALGAGAGEGLAGFWQRCGELAETTGLPVPGHAGVRARPAAALREGHCPPCAASDDLRIKVRAGSIGGVWHIEIHLPGAPSGIEGSPNYVAGNEETPMTG